MRSAPRNVISRNTTSTVALDLNTAALRRRAKVLTPGLDILRWYVGEPVEVQAYSNRMIWPELEDPTTVAIYQFASGCIGKVTVTWVPVAPMPKLYNVAVYGSKATIWRDEICLTGTHAFVPLPVTVPTDHSYAPEDRHFIDCLLAGKEPLITALDGARSAAAVLVVKDALRERRPVKIPQIG